MIGIITITVSIITAITTRSIGIIPGAAIHIGITTIIHIARKTMLWDIQKQLLPAHIINPEPLILILIFQHQAVQVQKQGL